MPPDSSQNNGDRTVHAEYPGIEIVRYDKAGKWYLEPRNATLKRQAVTLGEAVNSAIWALSNGGTVYYGLPGASAFDAKVRVHA